MWYYRFPCVICLRNCYLRRHQKIDKGSVNIIQACPLLLNINISKYRIVLQIVRLKIDICVGLIKN